MDTILDSISAGKNFDTIRQEMNVTDSDILKTILEYDIEYNGIPAKTVFNFYSCLDQVESTEMRMLGALLGVDTDIATLYYTKLRYLLPEHLIQRVHTLGCVTKEVQYAELHKYADGTRNMNELVNKTFLSPGQIYVYCKQHNLAIKENAVSNAQVVSMLKNGLDVDYICNILQIKPSRVFDAIESEKFNLGNVGVRTPRKVYKYLTNANELIPADLADMLRRSAEVAENILTILLPYFPNLRSKFKPKENTSNIEMKSKEGKVALEIKPKSLPVQESKSESESEPDSTYESELEKLNSEPDFEPAPVPKPTRLQVSPTVKDGKEQLDNEARRKRNLAALKPYADGTRTARELSLISNVSLQMIYQYHRKGKINIKKVGVGRPRNQELIVKRRVAYEDVTNEQVLKSFSTDEIEGMLCALGREYDIRCDVFTGLAKAN